MKHAIIHANFIWMLVYFMWCINMCHFVFVICNNGAIKIESDCHLFLIRDQLINNNVCQESCVMML